MTKTRVALLGYGTVGQGIYEVLQSHEERISELLGTDVEVVAVLIQNPNKPRNLPEDVIVTTEFKEILRLHVDVIFEATIGEQPAFSYLKAAIKQGCHVITANKVMFARHGKELLDQAIQFGVSVGYEATTAGGTPIIRTLEQLLQVNRIHKIEGILNGTSNFILTEMRTKGISFHEALSQAQEQGYAEADPTNDIEGMDAFYKLMILSQLAFGTQPDWNNVKKEGISQIGSSTISEASKDNQRLKHIATVEKINGEISASVQPVSTNSSHPLHGIEGVDNAITIHGDVVGSITIQGAGAGKLPTASAVVEDFVGIIQQHSKGYSPHPIAL